MSNNHIVTAQFIEDSKDQAAKHKLQTMMLPYNSTPNCKGVAHSAMKGGVVN